MFSAYRRPATVPPALPARLFRWSTPTLEHVPVRPDLDLAIETFDGGGEPLVLLMGFGAQMLLWPDAFCARLAEAGFRVIRVDHRDVGLSTRLPGLSWGPWGPPYSLEDMAMDVALLMDRLGIRRAHIAGASMGGMIAQLLAIHHPDRVRSLTSIMSAPSLAACGLPHRRLLASVGTLSPAATPAQDVERFVRRYRAVESPILRADQTWLEDLGRRCVARGSSELAVPRQAAAILCSGDRTDGLRTVDAPACVIHGALDPLVHPDGGRRTAEALPNAEWVLFDAMAHDLPRPLWGRITRAMVRTAARAA